MFLRKENIVVTVWKDKKPIYFLSSQSDPDNNMGSVDLNDQTWGYYMAGRKSKKWWRCLMWFFVDVAIVNAYILEKLSPHH